MYRVYTIFSVLLFITSFAFSQRKRAFLVGISNYDNAITNYEWNNIHGVEDVKLISPLLKSQGFTTTEILDSKATYKQITNSLSSFTNATKKDDIIYIHFSTHGQPFEDKSGDEYDKWDESIVPYDAFKNFKKGKYEGARHLIDDELCRYLNKIRKKVGENGHIYVIIDACHAGTSSRGDEITRGTMIGFSSNPNNRYNPPQEHMSTYILKQQKGYSPITFIEACRSDQINRELKTSKGIFGALSFNVAQALSTVKLSQNSLIFINAIKQSVKTRGNWPNNQNLVVEIGK